VSKLQRDINELKSVRAGRCLEGLKIFYPNCLHGVTTPKEALERLQKLSADTIARVNTNETKPQQHNATRYNVSMYWSFDQMLRLGDQIQFFCEGLDLATSKSLHKLGKLLHRNMGTINAELEAYLAVVKPVITFMGFLGDRKVQEVPIAHLVYLNYGIMHDQLADLPPHLKDLGNSLLRDIDAYLQKPALRWKWWKALRLLDPYQLGLEAAQVDHKYLYNEFTLLELPISGFDEFHAYCTAIMRDRDVEATAFWEHCVKAKVFEPWNSEALSLLYVPPSVLEVDGVISVANYLADPRTQRLTPAHFAERVMTHLTAQSEPVLS
jgi:hypothetical protein